MLTFKEAFNADFLRYKGPNYNPIKVIVSPALKSIYVGRKKSFSKKNIFWKVIDKYISHKYGNEISYDAIDKGIVLEHPYNITVAAGSKIGRNCTLFSVC